MVDKVMNRLDELGVLEDTFVKPWVKYTDITNRNSLSLMMTKLSEEFFSKSAAEKTAMEIDDDAPVNPKVMKGLISTEVNKQTKKLQAIANNCMQYTPSMRGGQP